jgi:transposase-like protein
MSQVPDSLEAVDLWQDGSGLTSAMMEGQPKAEDQPKALEDGVESPPEFDRVADVLGPLEQVVLAADEQLGSIQQRVSSEAGEMSAQAEKRIREASDEQRRRIAGLRAELTDRVSELATRFDAMLTVLDEVDRTLAIQGGWSDGADRGSDMRVTVTERHRVEISHEELAADKQESDVPPESDGPPASVAPPVDSPVLPQKEKKKKKGIRSWFRRSKGSSA